MKKLMLFFMCLWLFSNSVSAREMTVKKYEKFKGGFLDKYDDACRRAKRKALNKCYQKGYKYYFERKTKIEPENLSEHICNLEVTCANKKLSDTVEFIAPTK